MRIHAVLATPGAARSLVHCPSPRWRSLPPARLALSQRSSVCAPTPTSRETSSTAALSGGSNLATNRLLNVSAYRPTSSLHRHPGNYPFLSRRQVVCRGGPDSRRETPSRPLNRAAPVCSRPWRAGSQGCCSYPWAFRKRGLRTAAWRGTAMTRVRESGLTVQTRDCRVSDPGQSRTPVLR